MRQQQPHDSISRLKSEEESNRTLLNYLTSGVRLSLDCLVSGCLWAAWCQAVFGLLGVRLSWTVWCQAVFGLLGVRLSCKLCGMQLSAYTITVSRMICGTLYKYLINILGITCRFFLFLPLQDFLGLSRLIQLPHVLLGINKTYFVHMLWPIYAYLGLFRAISAHIRSFLGHISSVSQFCIRHIWLLFSPINLNYQLPILQYLCAGLHPFRCVSTQSQTCNI